MPKLATIAASLFVFATSIAAADDTAHITHTFAPLKALKSFRLQAASKSDSGDFQVTNKYGYRDHLGNVVIDLKFEDAHDFGDLGLAAVRLNKKWGYIDRSGQVVIPYHFDAATNFRANGTALVKVDNRYGYIGRNGQWIIPPTWDDAWPFSEYAEGKWLAAVKKSGRWGYVDSSGNTKIPFVYDEAWYFSRANLAPVKVGTKWGYVDASGRMAIAAKFDHASWSFTPASTPVAAAAIGNKWGFIDRNGHPIIPFEYDEVSWFSGKHGIAAVMKDGKYGYIDIQGNAITPVHFDFASDFNLEGYAVGHIGSAAYQVNRKGEMVFLGEFQKGPLVHPGTGVAEVQKFGDACTRLLDGEFKEVEAYNTYLAARLESAKRLQGRFPMMQFFPCVVDAFGE